jgi:hypothetical protein
LTEPNQALLDDETIPRVTLAGKQWPIPMMAPKQNAIVVPTILKIVPNVLSANDGKGKFDLARFAAVMTEEAYRGLITIVWMALTRGHSALTRAEFEEMPIGTMELVLAVLIIAQQTGVIKPGKPGDIRTGEEAAGNSQTGTL